jgi:hypothetical protein
MRKIKNNAGSSSVRGRGGCYRTSLILGTVPGVSYKKAKSHFLSVFYELK